MAKLTFERIENKYLVSKEQKEALINSFINDFDYDSHCQNGSFYTIKNIYLDTSDNRLLSLSINKPVFKEKLRIRKYDNQDDYYLEIKRKYKGVVGKRRISISEEELSLLLEKHIMPEKKSFVDKQTVNELSSIFSQYDVKPYALLTYDRISLFSKEDPDLRITFDFNVKCSKVDKIGWEHDDNCVSLIDEDHFIFEIKNTKNYPLWLARLLSENKIYPISFSKIGTFYKNTLRS